MVTRPCALCGTTADTHPYRDGTFCDPCSPAARAGRTVPVPDPARTVAGLASRVLPAPDPDRYGKSVWTGERGTYPDGNGRTVWFDEGGRRFADMLSRRPCLYCRDRGPRTRVAGHKGDHS